MKGSVFTRTWLRRTLSFLVIAVAAVWSFDALRNLAQHVGFGRLSWMFPICIDAVAALGMDIWMTKSPAWRTGRSLALTAIVVSLAGNVTDWVLRSSDPLAAVLGAIPPAALAAVLGLMHSNARGAEERAAAEADKQARRSRKQAPRHGQTSQPVQLEPKPETVTKLTPVERGILEPATPTTETTRITRPRTGRSDDELIAEVRQLIETNSAEIGKRHIMAQLGIGSDRALRILREVRNNDEGTGS